MESTALKVVLALLPFAVLLVGFMVFKMSALKLSFIVLVLELLICIGFYGMGVPKAAAATVWGNITIWTGFLVLWSGQIFGQCFRTTGALNVMLKTLNKLLPTQTGKAVTLCSIVGGYVGAFNGFATYPVTIPGLVNLGVDGFRAAVGYLVYFAWSIAFVSLFMAAGISANVTNLPIEHIVQAMGMIALPVITVSVIGFYKIIGFSLKDKDNLTIAILTILANMLGLFLFTQVFPELYILTMVAASSLSLLVLWLYSKKYDRSAYAADAGGEQFGTGTVLKAFAPLIVSCVLVILFSYPMRAIVGKAAFQLALWGYRPTTINIITSPGFYVFVTALMCYVFAVKPTSTFGKDFTIATKRVFPSLVTLFLGGAMVNLMLDTGQIVLLAQQMTQWGTHVYGVLLSCLSFLAGMAFGQGVPANALFSRMQIPASEFLQVAPHILVGIAALITMSSANPLKPSILTYTSGLAGIKGQDGAMFNVAIKWQSIHLLVIIAMVLIVL